MTGVSTRETIRRIDYDVVKRTDGYHVVYATRTGCGKSVFGPVSKWLDATDWFEERFMEQLRTSEPLGPLPVNRG